MFLTGECQGVVHVPRQGPGEALVPGAAGSEVPWVNHTPLYGPLW